MKINKGFLTIPYKKIGVSGNNVMCNSSAQFKSIHTEMAQNPIISQNNISH